jgi:hypothetical protein
MTVTCDCGKRARATLSLRAQLMEIAGHTQPRILTVLGLDPLPASEG